MMFLLVRTVLSTIPNEFHRRYYFVYTLTETRETFQERIVWRLEASNNEVLCDFPGLLCWPHYSTEDSMTDFNTSRVYFENSAPILRVEDMKVAVSFYVEK